MLGGPKAPLPPLVWNSVYCISCFGSIEGKQVESGKISPCHLSEIK